MLGKFDISTRFVSTYLGLLVLLLVRLEEKGLDEHLGDHLQDREQDVEAHRDSGHSEVFVVVGEGLEVQAELVLGGGG